MPISLYSISSGYAAGARLSEAADNLQAAALSYGRAMLSMAQAADGVEELEENDRHFMQDSLIRQTPGWIATGNVLGSIEAGLKLNRIDIKGRHSRSVLSALKVEHEHFHEGDDG